MSVYAIGDIHGSIEALRTIFNQGLIKRDDKIIFLGDYVDKGSNSNDVIEWLLTHRKLFDFEFILGNHEIMMNTARRSPERLLEWLYFVGASTLDSYQIGDDKNWADKIPKSHWAFIDSCKHYIEIGKFIFVHAGLESGKTLNDQDQDHLFWKKFEEPEAYSSERIVVCGHTSRKDGEIANFGHTICIDTYAHGGMWLTCLNVESGEFIKANNKRETVIGNLNIQHAPSSNNFI
ncbi:metallophosphoesterase family protein [Pseudochryseolinea flava]|uniref:Serine/threonine protein phosphatase n=1 Tax=Pseudochryseolinea flava TaxID=2059302 RepID=A0A364Y202_9BACT|nr:metallophosphoesterase family protein [Pseudochryseolinea flava]RAW00744.1 serine/threonine protein phosphatase [Pseudochryseolinea flava]